MEPIFSLEMDVRDYEVDYQGIVNNSVYLNYMEHTRHEFCRNAGITFAEMHAAGIDPVVQKAEIEYHASLKSGDHFVSRLSMERKGPRFIFTQKIYRKADVLLCVSARITIACIINGRLTRGDELAKYFYKYL